MMYQMIIIDDEAEIRNGLSRFFPWESLGYAIAAVFDNAYQAIEFLNTHKVHIVLTDIRMPGMTGLELAKIIRDNYADTRVVLISGHADFEYARKALEFGVRYYIVKPTVYQELLDIFSRLKLELDQAQPPDDSLITQEAVGYYEDIIQRVKSFVKLHCNTVTLEAAAENINMNPYYLSSFFKHHTGEKFSEYVNAVKMKKAAELLAVPTNRIYEVSDSIGYQNPSNFGRAFKAYYGISPRHYRAGYKDVPKNP